MCANVKNTRVFLIFQQITGAIFSLYIIEKQKQKNIFTSNNVYQYSIFCIILPSHFCGGVYVILTRIGTKCQAFLTAQRFGLYSYLHKCLPTWNLVQFLSQNINHLIQCHDSSSLLYV